MLRYGILVPRGTPAPVIAKLGAEVIKIMARNDVITLLASSGAEPLPGNAVEYAKVIASELAAWRQVIKTAGIRP